MDIKKFENNLIAFDLDNGMINATDLISAYNRKYSTDKRIDNYLRQKSTKEFITALKSDALIIASDYQLVTNKKNAYGKSSETWVNKWIAYDLAAWLSPEFRLYVYSVFDNAMTEKLRNQQMQLDYFWDKEDQNDIYKKR